MKISVGESFTVALVLGIENFWIRVGEYQNFLSKILCLTVPKISIGESFTVALFSGSEKFWMGGGVSRFSVETFMFHRAENFRRGVLHCCINIGYRKSLEKRGEGVPRFSVETFMSHSAENFCRGILYCCVNFWY